MTRPSALLRVLGLNAVQRCCMSESAVRYIEVSACQNGVIKNDVFCVQLFCFQHGDCKVGNVTRWAIFFLDWRDVQKVNDQKCSIYFSRKCTPNRRLVDLLVTIRNFQSRASRSNCILSCDAARLNPKAARGVASGLPGR
jgi:hypothetical protein